MAGDESKNAEKNKTKQHQSQTFSYHETPDVPFCEQFHYLECINFSCPLNSVKNRNRP